MLSSFGKTLFARLWEDPVNVQETSRRQLTRARQETVRRALGVWEGRDRFPSRGRRAGVSEASSSGGAVPGRSGPTCSVSSDAAGRPSGRRPWSVISGALLRRGGEGIWLLLSVFVLTSICLRAQSRRLLAS